jgi:hypothetical protein
MGMAIVFPVAELVEAKPSWSIFFFFSLAEPVDFLGG